MTSKACVDHLGNKFESVSKLCKYWKITRNRYNKLIKEGEDLKVILEYEKKGEEYTDHLGNKFGSKKEMCRYWKIPQYLYNARIRLGWSLERTLTTPNQRKY